MMKILIADDDAAIRESIQLILTEHPYELSECGEIDQVYSRILELAPDLILLDVHFRNKTSLDLMRALAAENQQIPIIVLSGAASAAEAAEAIKLGAYDFIEKPLSAGRLCLTIERCLENASLRQKLQGVTVQSVSAAKIIGRSMQADKLRRTIEQYAGKDVRILITGETGVGKEVVAQNLWQRSARASRPFLVVNSAAIPESLLESELFGHKKGSFTGAISDQVGKIEMADRGTLFLDEVGDLSVNAQTKLLRFLETGEIQKVGSNQIKTVDVRLIAATSRDLEKEMEKGTFRADLFYRLNVVRIALAPLRDRKEDIYPLFNEFVAYYCVKFKESPKTIAPDVAEVLESHDWPGNVRELRNVAERVVLTAAERILKEHLQVILGLVPAQKRALAAALPIEIVSLKEFKRRTEKEYIESVLTLTKGSVTKAAQLLKIDRTYLHQKMTNHSIKSPS
jgi:two-component system nitrogen regulation response regulator NtrX